MAVVMLEAPRDSRVARVARHPGWLPFLEVWAHFPTSSCLNAPGISFGKECIYNSQEEGSEPYIVHDLATGPPRYAFLGGRAPAVYRGFSACHMLLRAVYFPPRDPHTGP